MADGSQSAAKSVHTTCPYCGVGCGVVATPTSVEHAAILGDQHHPANFGRLCSKGSALGETLGNASRLEQPEIKGVRVDWDTALNYTASELARVRDTYGPASIAFYLSGQLLTEDYYVANKLAKGFIGTPHVDTNSRLCMASSVAGHKRAFGADVVPGCYDDLDQADVVILVGSNTAWCHPVLYQRMQAARQKRGTQIVNIDPRRTATTEGADLQLSLIPGSDVCLWNGLLVWLNDHGLTDVAYIAAHTDGFDETLKHARERAPSTDHVAFKTGLDKNDVETFYKLWVSSDRVVTCYSQGVNQSVQGTDKVNAIINCHLATGRIGREGMGPFSLTGQPNAMGGREVGGLANMLAAHMGFTDVERDRVGRFWNAPNLVQAEGLKAVEMFDAIAEGRIKALWVMGTNPLVSLPRADAARDALRKLQFLAVSEVVRETDTARFAHVRLPAHGWGEKDGTVTNSERRISRQRAFKAATGGARADWWIMSRVADRLGFAAAFKFRGPAEIFREHAALSGFENTGDRVFNISGLQGITDDDFDNLAPTQWPFIKDAPASTRLFSDGRYATPNGRARLIPVARSLNPSGPNDDFPFLLNTGRIRDQWHTMTRTGLVPRLNAHLSERYVEIAPNDAQRLGIKANDIVAVSTADGAATARASITDNVAPGTVFMPMHWSRSNSSSAPIGALVHAIVDPISGQPDAKATPASVKKVDVTEHGFALLRHVPDQNSLVILRLAYWSIATIDAGYELSFATSPNGAPADMAIDVLLGSKATLTLRDSASRTLRSARLSHDRVDAIAFAGTDPGLRASTWLRRCYAADRLTSAERRSLLAGTAPDATNDQGAIICVCHQIGATAISNVISEGCATTDAIGAACRAGTNCGSCLPEINRMLKKIQSVAALA